MPGTKPRVVVVEDERALREDMVEYLSAQGFHAQGAESSTALDSLLSDGESYDLAVLDINLPGESGFGIAARLRQQGGIGIVIVSARSGVGDKVVGLEVGADAYLVKPVDLRELEAQLRSLLRRVGPRRETAEPPPPDAAPGAWTFHSVQRTLQSPEGAAVPLTSAEFSLLKLLLETPGEPVSRQTISRALY
ncbi:MAG: response regulator transcription factor, partial [Alphaproteobacteria bacterium]|nr:response regulator transcription factor [Alphaproteobacteria bacterium]